MTQQLNPSAAPPVEQGAQPVPPECDVRHIMLAIEPGDGSGVEIFAKSVTDVVDVLTRQAERIEELEMQVKAAQPVAQEQT